MKRATRSLSELANTAREELPCTIAAIRLSSMEIGDLTPEVEHLSPDISDGVTNQLKLCRLQKLKFRQIGSLARGQTIWSDLCPPHA